jgi:hypothetical protein
MHHPQPNGYDVVKHGAISIAYAGWLTLPTVNAYPTEGAIDQERMSSILKAPHHMAGFVLILTALVFVAICVSSGTNKGPWFLGPVVASTAGVALVRGYAALRKWVLLVSATTVIQGLLIVLLLEPLFGMWDMIQGLTVLGLLYGDPGRIRRNICLGLWIFSVVGYLALVS